MTKEQKDEIFNKIERNIDYKNSIKLNKVKKTLMSCIDIKKVINETRKIIDESNSFNFRSERAKKFIDPKNPVFILKTDMIPSNEKEVKKLISNDSLVSDLTDKITEQVNTEIASKITTFITESALDKEKFDELFKDLPDELTDAFLTNIFIIRLSIQDNSVLFKIFR